MKKQSKKKVKKPVIDQSQAEDAQLLDVLDDEEPEAPKAAKAPETPEAPEAPGQSAVRPLVVCDENGGFLFLNWTNPKVYAKSAQQGILWVAHPQADSILPSGKEAQIRYIQDRGDYYYAEVLMPVEERLKEPEKPAPASVEKSRTETQGIIAELVALIAQRKKDRPEGSYTTELFQDGTDRIRKKTGEEAVELILARSPREMIYEAADLVYHMLVLLEAEGLHFADVLEELKSRRK